ncbi:enoyl-CoA hydratase-related protein [Flavobacteriales bacterium]|jgi:enoyl-CoA hydratase|nr:enoyl-CoA hydratase-related protein [Flavobacteriales bacterium]MDC3395215.1 enoyl-CoA hydratase-related protein [Flavobacteriales bacterium]MDG1348209.1 enoyl-CoA hydratase-related protein [Flavobacteriales bacterium]
MNYNNILSETNEGVCYITINRPKQLNALNGETIVELNQAITAADTDSDVRCIILTGAENKAFVAGADIKEFAEFDKSKGENLARKGQELLFDLLENAATPSIAAINGFALGGGLELAMACHIRIASDNAKMGLPEVSLGVIPGYGGTQRLASLVGKGKAMEMITTAGMLSANEAKEWGLVNYVCAQEELIPMAEKLASKIKRNSPMAIAKAIKSVNAGFTDGVNGYDVEITEFGSCFETPEFIEGTTAFMEKRKANF